MLFGAAVSARAMTFTKCRGFLLLTAAFIRMVCAAYKAPLFYGDAANVSFILRRSIMPATRAREAVIAVFDYADCIIFLRYAHHLRRCH
jgi:hypothetical protein